ncbi:sensor histidine kinase [Streptomyces albidus (ex Kaewkla and Franco 2022)]|uniref:sensor histidine kinase n=1 Tax=Streptomyces albidus (ex Kaewkla and Franco 2022) TaxID=722709 RepID=UPI0015EF0CC6|nr:histidine kinase [Streptomyces albidus (ex Kaewkla and Franco 2022)]
MPSTTASSTAHPRPGLPSRLRPHRVGVLIAVAGMVGGLVLWQLGLYNNPRVGSRYGAWLLIPLTVMCLASLGRRRGQPWALAVSIVALAGDIAMGSLLATVVVFTDIVYAAVIYGSTRVSRAVLPVSVAFTVAVTCALLAVFRTPETLLLGAFSAGITIAPAWTGVIIRDHRNAAAAERLRAEQTALLAEMDRVQAVTAERARMARELHDVVANHLSAIAIHSTAALSLGDGRPDKDGKGGGEDAEEQSRAATHTALGVIRENSVQGLAEMRRLIGLLRDASGDSDETPPTSPTLAGLDALLDRARAGAENTGLRFTLRDQREPGASLPAPVELAAYRVVQESVTNALKHSGGGTVTVNVDRVRIPGPLTVRVTSPLGDRGGDRAPRAPGSGSGLIGMRERAELLGGTLRAGPVDAPLGAKVWEVRAELPVEEGNPR